MNKFIFDVSNVSNGQEKIRFWSKAINKFTLTIIHLDSTSSKDRIASPFPRFGTVGEFDNENDKRHSKHGHDEVEK